MKELEIKIIGKTKTGKTTAAVMIQALLATYGVNVSIKDDEPLTREQRSTLAVNAEGILRGTKIKIVVETAKREVKLPEGFHSGEPAVFKETPKKQ